MRELARLHRSSPAPPLGRGRWQAALVALFALGAVVAVVPAPPARGAAFAPDSLGYPWAGATTLNAAADEYGYAVCPGSDPGCKGATLVVGGVAYGELDPLRYFLRNCTSWAAYRLMRLGVPASAVSGLGNGGQWGRSAAGRGLAVDATPRAGDAAVVLPTGSQPFGHVAVVEAVNADGTISVSEYNRFPNGLGERATGSPADLGFSQFVHFPQSEAALRGASAGPAAVDLPAQVLPSGSFESGSGGWWVPGPGSDIAWYRDPSIAHDGAGFLATDATGPGGGIFKDVAVAGGASYAVSAWVRAQGAPSGGQFCAWSLWADAEAFCTRFSAGAGWVPVQVVVDPRNNANTTLRVQVYPDVGAGPVELDTVSVIG